MNNLQSLRNLVQNLNGEEFQFLKRSYNFGSSSSEEGKSLQLLTILRDDINFSSNDIQKILYNNLNYTAFNKLCSRLKDRILDAILLDASLNRSNYSKRNKIVIEVKKSLIQADILSQRGLRDEADRICKKAVKLSQHFELYDLQAQALKSRERFLNIRKNSSEILKIQQDISSSERKQNSISRSRQIFNIAANKISNSSSSNKYFIELKESIFEIEKEYNETQSLNILYLLNFLKTEYYQVLREFEKANDCLFQIDEILSHESLYSDLRKGTTLLNIAGNFIHLEQFEKAAEYSELALVYFPNNLVNRSLVYEILFYSNLYQDKFEAAANYIKRLVAMPMQNNVILKVEKWKFLEAYMLFLSGKFNQAIVQLESIKEIDRDKEGWNINKRLLLIMCRIELNELHSIDLNVSNLEKFVKRINKSDYIKKRYLIIVRILIKLLNENLNFRLVHEKRKKYFDELSGNEIGIAWEVKDPEIIPFHLWYYSKMNNVAISLRSLFATS